MFGCPGIENLGNIGMGKQRQDLTFGLEAAHDFLGIHPRFDDLQSHPATDRACLFGQIHDPHPAFTQDLKQLVGSHPTAGPLDQCVH
jgi:hypothetical protein